ncbi:MAG: GTP 3',8-cyclase MoaA [bacterium]
MPIFDQFNRPLRDLRISVTDRCNFRCTYCMPKEIFDKNHHFLRKEKLLSFEEIYRLASILVELGIRKIRLTGGEPLMRRQLERLIEMLATLPNVDLSLTTNGSFPIQRVQSLKDAGLNRITVSLDALDDAIFKAMNDVEFPVERVLKWVDACRDAGFAPVKINMVVQRGVNDQSILPMAYHFKDRANILRFIEYMDVGSSNGWRMDDVVSAAEICSIIQSEMPIEAIEPSYRGEVAKRWRYKDGGGEVGFIASVTQAFCRDCTRLRLSADGSLYTCLFAANGHDLRGLLRENASDKEISESISSIWQARTDRYSEIRSAETMPVRKVEMSYIGG